MVHHTTMNVGVYSSPCDVVSAIVINVISAVYFVAGKHSIKHN